MFGYALRFKLKKSLIGIAALSLLTPVASHADVTKGRWIFDGFSRSAADGRGSTCLASGGDTHAFDANNCTSAATEAQKATAAANEAKKAAAAKAAAEKAKLLSEKTLPGGQSNPTVRRADGIKLFDGFGRTCIRDGSSLSATSACTEEPAQQAAAPAAASRKAVAPAAPVEELAPGSLLGSSNRGAYVYEVPGSTIRDGYGKSCIKDGRWNVGTATEDCAPDLFSAYRAKMKPAETAVTQAAPAPAPQPTQARSAAPDPNGPAQPDAGPGVSPGADRAATGATASVVDNSLPSFPVTTYAPELAVVGAAGAMALADDDDFSDLRFEEPEDDDAPVFAATEDAIPDADAIAAADDEEEAEEAASLDADEDGDDDSRPAVAADMLRDDESLALADAGALADDDDDDDDNVAAVDDDDEDVPMMADADLPSDDTAALATDDDDDDEAVAEDDSDDAPLFAADEEGVPEAAALAATEDEEETPDFSFDDDDDEPVALAADDADDGIPDGAAMALMDDDEEEAVAAADEEDDDEPAVMAADETTSEGIPEAPATALMDDDDDDAVAAADDDDDDEPAFLAAEETASEGIPDGAAMALTDDDEEDTIAAAEEEEDEAPVAAAEPEAPMVAAVEEDVEAPVFAEPDDEPATAAAEPIPEAEPAVMALVDEPDEPAAADTADIDETVTPADMLSDADRTLPSEPVAVAAAPEPAPVAKAAPEPQTAPEFPVTKYEIEKEPVVVAQAEEPKKPAEPAPVKAAPADPNIECPPTTIQVEGARFDFDRARLRPDITASLDTIAERLQAQKCEAIHIVGHTDRIGTVKYNQRLSEKRAAAAKAYLVKKHKIDPERITTAGRSELDPVTQMADCQGKRKKSLIKCYAPDRRVVVTATTQKPAK